MKATQNDKYLDKKILVLDHGFVCLLDYMGDDAAIASAARCSMAGEGTKKVSDDTKLIRRLMRDKHTSPFEMVELKFLCQMPIFVARQWIRHRTANVNEMSARYGELPEQFYVPEDCRVAYQNPVNKQGSGKTVSLDIADSFTKSIKDNAEGAFHSYHEYLGRGDLNKGPVFTREAFEDLQKNGGISRELARIDLPLSTYTKWVWKIDLHNLLHFLRLRLDPHAQYEIRVFAEAMAEIVKEMYPITWKAFEDFQLDAVTLSGPEVAMLKYLTNGSVGDRPKFFNDKEEASFYTTMDKMGIRLTE